MRVVPRLLSGLLPGLALLCAFVASSSHALAQVGNLIDVPDPTPLPTPGFVERFVYSNPLPLACGLIIASLLVGGIARARSTASQRRSVGLASLVLFLAGVGVYITGRVVQSPRERMMQATRELVDAVAKANLSGVQTGMTQACVLTYHEAPMGLPAQLILERVSQQFGGGGIYALEDYKIRAMEAVERSPGFGSVQVKVWAKAKAGFPINSWWRLDYEEQSGTWKASAIAAIAISGVSNAGGASPR